jgi:hypothetical protein
VTEPFGVTGALEGGGQGPDAGSADPGAGRGATQADVIGGPLSRPGVAVALDPGVGGPARRRTEDAGAADRDGGPAPEPIGVAGAPDARPGGDEQPHKSDQKSRTSP